MTIRASLHQVEGTLLLAVAMVILVVYVFLRSARAALIPAVVVPVSLIGTFGAMYLLDYSLDNFSLMALTIATGFVVDDAIVVMENTMRHIEAGMARLPAALQGAREVGFTVISMSLSLVAVFIPFQLVGGIVGRLFREFTVTLSVAILISLVISLTTTPMMCAWLLGRDPLHSQRGWGGAFERGFAGLQRRYQRTLAWALDHGPLMMLILLLTVGLNVYMYIVVPKGFLPQQDTGQLRGGMRGDASASFQLMKSKLTQVVDIVRADPAVATVVGNVGGGGGGPMGGGGGGGGASANLSIALKPLAERKDSADRVIARLRPQMAQVTGVQAFLQAVQDIGGAGGGRSANAQYQYTLLGDDLSELRDWSMKLRQALQDGARSHRRRHRSATRGSRDQSDHRSRRRLAAGPDGRADRQHAGQRLRAVAGIDHLQSLQPAAVPRGHGSGAGVLAEPGRVGPPLRQHCRRSGQRHAGDPGRGRHDIRRHERCRHYACRMPPATPRRTRSPMAAAAIPRRAPP